MNESFCQYVLETSIEAPPPRALKAHCYLSEAKQSSYETQVTHIRYDRDQRIISELYFKVSQSSRACAGVILR